MTFGIGYIRSEAPGAIPNGARIVKVVFEDGDAHGIGALGNGYRFCRTRQAGA